MRVVVLVFCGAMVNVAVAWACAYWVKPYQAQAIRTIYFSGTGRWHLSVWSKPGAACFSSYWIEWSRRPRLGDRYPVELVPEWSKPHPEPATWNDASQVDHLQGQASGWPLLGMCSYRTGAPLPTQLTQGIPVGAGIIGVQYSTQRVLPLNVIWPAFAINSLFYAAALAPLVLIPVIRRKRRIRRGRCPECAYPIGTGNVCTECGYPLKPLCEI